ncbi:hypothetical protein IT575_04765 [bacterium]|nr:hypothetical protein [bacterium]
MSEERLKVLEMVANGVISAEEGVRLLEALGAAERRGPVQGASMPGPGQGMHGHPGHRGKINVELPLPSLKIPRINLGGLGDMYVELKHNLGEVARTGYSRLKSTKAGKYLELHDYEVEGPGAEGVEHCNLKMELQAASLKLKAGDVDTPLISIKARKVQEQPVLITTFQDGQAEAALRHGLGRCGIELSPQPSYSLVLQSAASDASLDLSALRIEDMLLENNAGSVKMQLGSGCERVLLRIRNNAGDVQVKVPHDFAVRVIGRENLSANNFEKYGLKLDEEGAASEDWGTNPRQVEIQLDQNVAHFSLSWRKVEEQAQTA